MNVRLSLLTTLVAVSTAFYSERQQDEEPLRGADSTIGVSQWKDTWICVGQGYVVHVWKGGKWVPSGSGQVESATVIVGDRIVAVGIDGQLWQKNGDNWTPKGMGGVKIANIVASKHLDVHTERMSPTATLFGVGKTEKKLYQRRGFTENWREIPFTRATKPKAVHWDSNGLFVLGENNLIYRRKKGTTGDNTIWEQDQFFYYAPCYTVAVKAPQNCFVVLEDLLFKECLDILDLADGVDYSAREIRARLLQIRKEVSELREENRLLRNKLEKK